MPVDNEIHAASHCGQGRQAPAGLIPVPIDEFHGLSCRPQGLGDIVLTLQAPLRGGVLPESGQNTVLGVFQGQPLHPAGEGGLQEQDEIFGGIGYGVIDAIAVHGLFSSSPPEVENS